MLTDDYEAVWTDLVDLKMRVTKLLDARTMDEAWELNDRRRTADETIRVWLDQNLGRVAKHRLVEDLQGLFALRYQVYDQTRCNLDAEAALEADDGIPVNLRGNSLESVLDAFQVVRERMTACERQLSSYWVGDQLIPDLGGHLDEIRVTALNVQEIRREMHDLRKLLVVFGSFQDMQDEWLDIYNGVLWLEHLANKQS